LAERRRRLPDELTGRRSHQRCAAAHLKQVSAPYR